MGFEKLQQRIHDFFIEETSHPVDRTQMTLIRERTLAEFSRKKSTHFFFRLWKLNWVRSAIVGAIVLSLLPIFGGERSAGELQPDGIVEIVRDGKVFIATEKTPIRIGDQILVGNNSSARIQLKRSLETVLGERAEARIPQQDSLFLVRGTVDGDISTGAIETGRGKINAENGATLSVSVSESGETHIRPRENDVLVTSWDKTKTILIAGEVLRLYTDGTLPPEMPQDLNLSSSQILAIQAKLLIARTKALNSVEARLQENSEKAIAELESATRTFLSVVQVLKSSRNLELLRRENLSLITTDEVIKRLSARTNRTNLLKNALAVKTLLDVVEQERAPQFLTIDSGLLVFNRYALLQRLFAPLPDRQRHHGHLLQDQYVSALVRQIANADSATEEILFIVSVVPQSGAGRQFLQQVADKLPPSLMEQLDEIILNWGN